MASWESISYISAIKYLQDAVIVYLDEFHAGYKRANGERVEDKYYSYKTIWKAYFKKYISEHFGEGMLVHVKGDMLPYEMRQGAIVDGYTIIGEHITRASFPRADVKREHQMIKDSQLHSSGTPDLEAYNAPDF